MKSVVFLAAAQNDLVEIFAYIAEHNVEAAQRLIDRLRDSTRRLRSFPLSAPERGEYGSGVRKLSVHGYAIFYRVTDTEILVSRVIHGSRDFDTLDF